MMQKYQLKLFINRKESTSTKALNNLKRFCEEHLFNKYEIDIIDIYEEPSIATKYQITETPTLIKEAPPPIRTLISDLTDYQELLTTILSVEPEEE